MINLSDLAFSVHVKYNVHIIYIYSEFELDYSLMI